MQILYFSRFAVKLDKIDCRLLSLDTTSSIKIAQSSLIADYNWSSEQ